jgi:hypothetical protein
VTGGVVVGLGVVEVGSGLEYPGVGVGVVSA